MARDPRNIVEDQKHLALMRESQRLLDEARASVDHAMHEIGKENANTFMGHRWAAITFARAALAVMELGQ
jgi:hypothetical protein